MAFPAVTLERVADILQQVGIEYDSKPDCILTGDARGVLVFRLFENHIVFEGGLHPNRQLPASLEPELTDFIRELHQKFAYPRLFILPEDAEGGMDICFRFAQVCDHGMTEQQLTTLVHAAISSFIDTHEQFITRFPQYFDVPDEE